MKGSDVFDLAAATPRWRRGESIYWHAFSVKDELLMFDHGRGAGAASSGDDLTGADDNDEDLRLALLMSMSPGYD